MSTMTALPRWDASVYFPGLESPEFLTALQTFKKKLEAMDQAFSDQKIEDGPKFGSLETDAVEKLETALGDMNGVLSDARLIRAYVYSFVSTDSTNALALATQSQLASPMTALSKLGARLTAWIGRLPSDLDKTASETVQSHRFPIELARIRASKLLPAGEESLLADLVDTSTGSWGRLHSNYTSQLMVEVGGETKPMSAVRTMAYADADSRRVGYEAELAAWKQHELSLAASMNSIKGQTSLIAKKRGWNSLLDESLFAAHIGRESLEAMMSAVKDSFPDFRRYLRAKAKKLGHSGGLPWYELFAPLGANADWSYDKAEDFIETKFRTYSDKLADYARESFNRNTIDAEPRPGKVDGAFCSGTRGGESLILMNYKPAFGSVSTLAHELGHGYHNLCLAERTELQRGTPMTLAETASIFCETIIKRAAIGESHGEERLGILEAALQGSCQVVIDIASRFYFESHVVEKRAERELSAAELCEAMTNAQKETYGDGLSSWHPYMWAVKPHYYSQRAFYNFPYTFGLLFSLGLYAVYQSEPNGFHARYDALLSETGMESADTLAARFGIDINSKQFWAGSLGVIKQDIDEFVALVE